MFDPICTHCERRVLLGYRRLESLRNTDEGIALVFRCHCGHPAVLLTGAGRHQPELVGA